MSTGALENPNESEFTKNCYHILHNAKHNIQCACYVGYFAVNYTILEAFLRYYQTKQNCIVFLKSRGNPGSRITKRWNHQISRTFEASEEMRYRFSVPQSFLMLPTRLSYLKPYVHPSTQSHRFETSRDMVVNRLRPWWIVAVISESFSAVQESKRNTDGSIMTSWLNKQRALILE